MTDSTVTAGLVVGLLDYVENRGKCEGESSFFVGAPKSEIGSQENTSETRARLLSDSNMSFAQVSDPDNRVPLSDYLNLLHLSKRMIGDPALGLRYGADVGMAQISVVGLIMEASSTMGEAFAQLQRFSQIATEIDGFGSTPRYELTQIDGNLHMRDQWTYGAQMPEMIEGAFARLVCGPRRFLHQPHVLAVHFSYPEPSYSSVYDDVFQCPVHFDSPYNSMQLHPDITSWPVAQNQRYVFGVLSKHANGLLEQLAGETRLSARITALLLPKLHTGDHSIETVSTELCMSRQTVFRKLAAEGVTYTQVLDTLRQRLAMDYLANKRVSVHETAYLVGFSEPAAFSRAFKRWAGVTPSEFRLTPR